MEFRTLANEIGIDWAKTMGRFSNNEALFERFLLKFPTDPTFAELEQAFADNRMDAAQMAVHTLKGISANLGIDGLFGLCSEYMQHSRGNMYSMLPQDFQLIAAEYERVIALIRAYRA